MLIERAIEKLKKTGGMPDPSPALRDKARDAVSRRRGAAPKPAIRPQRTLDFPKIPLDPAMLAANRIVDPASTLKRDAAAQSSFRMLRSRMLNKMRTAGWSSLAITSPGAGEGKTLVATNLALSMAREGSSDVFLLDLDMRNPSICRSLGVSPRAEIVDFFQGSTTPESLFFSVGSDGLLVAGGQASTDAASELIASAQFEALIDYIKGFAFNPIIIIDLPPVLVSDEAIVLAPRVDATALIVAEGRTHRDGLVKAKQLLAENAFAGVILNRSTEPLGATEYYGYANSGGGVRS